MTTATLTELTERGKITDDFVCTIHGRRPVVCDRGSGTEKGSFYWYCTKCRAGLWSGH